MSSHGLIKRPGHQRFRNSLWVVDKVRTVELCPEEPGTISAIVRAFSSAQEVNSSCLKVWWTAFHSSFSVWSHLAFIPGSINDSTTGTSHSLPPPIILSCKAVHFYWRLPDCDWLHVHTIQHPFLRNQILDIKTIKPHRRLVGAWFPRSYRVFLWSFIS